MKYCDVKKAETIWALLSKRFEFQHIDAEQITEVHLPEEAAAEMLSLGNHYIRVDGEHCTGEEAELKFVPVRENAPFTLKVLSYDIMGLTDEGLIVYGIVVEKDGKIDIQIHEQAKIVRQYDAKE